MTIKKPLFLTRNPAFIILGIIIFLASSIMYQSSKDFEWYVQNDCLGKDEIYFDGEGWSKMDFCMDKNEGDDLVYCFYVYFTNPFSNLFINELEKVHI